MFFLVPYALAVVFAYYGLLIEPAAEALCFGLFSMFTGLGLVMWLLERAAYKARLKDLYPDS